MRLGPRERDAAILERCLLISDMSFDLIERPSREIFTGWFREGEVFVNNELDPDGYAIVINRGGPWLWSIAVVRSRRKCGIGQSLLKEAIDFAKEAGDHLTLTVRADNAAAQTLYLRNDFRPVKVIPKYYTSGIDGVVMTLKF